MFQAWERGPVPAQASFPGILHLQFLIACCMQKRSEKVWGILAHDLWQLTSRIVDAIAYSHFYPYM